MGSRVITVSSKNGGVDLKRLMKALAKLEITSILLEGGTRLITSSFNQNIVDKIFFFYAPKILGGRLSHGITGGEGVNRIRQALKVRDLKVRKCGDDVLVEGYVNKKVKLHDA